MKKLVIITLSLLPVALQSAEIDKVENTEADQELLDAAQSGNLEEQLLDAAQVGNLEQIEKAIKEGANVNAKDKDHLSTALHHAVLEGFTEIATALINAKADVNAGNYDFRRPLHYVASNGRDDIATLLIKAKADVDAKNKDQETPLHMSAYWGKANLIKILLDAGADFTLHFKVGECEENIFYAIKKSYGVDQDEIRVEITQIIVDQREKSIIDVCQLLETMRAQLNLASPLVRMIAQYVFGDMS